MVTNRYGSKLLDLLFEQLDSLFVLFGFFCHARLATGFGKFLISFDQDRGIGHGVFVVTKFLPEFKNDSANLFVLADQRGAYLGRSAKHQPT